MIEGNFFSKSIKEIKFYLTIDEKREIHYEIKWKSEILHQIWWKSGNSLWNRLKSERAALIDEREDILGSRSKSMRERKFWSKIDEIHFKIDERVETLKLMNFYYKIDGQKNIYFEIDEREGEILLQNRWKRETCLKSMRERNFCIKFDERREIHSEIDELVQNRWQLKNSCLKTMNERKLVFNGVQSFAEKKTCIKHFSKLTKKHRNEFACSIQIKWFHETKKQSSLKTSRNANNH